MPPLVDPPATTPPALTTPPRRLTAATADNQDDVDALLGRLLTPHKKAEDPNNAEEEEEEDDDVFFWETPHFADLMHVLAWPVGLVSCVVLLCLGTYTHLLAACKRRVKLWGAHVVSYLYCCFLWSSESPGGTATKGLKIPRLMPRMVSVGANSKSGLHWYGLGNACEKDDPHFHPLFDPTKPTVIYVHGYQPRTIIRQFKESFNWADNDDEFGLDINAADHWLRDGWNVGIFYWNTFADEPFVHDAEAKIWTKETSAGMRYRMLTQCGKGVKWRYVSSTVPCVSEQLAAVLRRRFPRGAASYRLVGHSLGAQVVVHAATLLAQAKRAEADVVEAGADDERTRGSLDRAASIPSTTSPLAAKDEGSPSFVLPSRIALLDAFFTLGPKRYLGWRTLATVLKEEIVDLTLTENVVFEQYQTSILSFAASIHLKPLTAFFDLDPKHIPWWKLRARHVCAPHLYFISMASDQVGKRVMKESEGACTPFWGEVSHHHDTVLEDEDVLRGMAKTSDEHLRVLMQQANVVDELWQLFTHNSYRSLLMMG